MASLELNYPVQNPINQNNLFGTSNAMYISLGQKGHPGLDFECPLYTPIYSPCDGDAFYAHDNNGGDGIWIRVPNNGLPQYNIILWHMVPPTDTAHPFQISTAPGVVTKVKTGQFLGYSGDSGYPIESTGPHLHLGVMPCDFTGEATAANNGYLGCVDPMPFLVKPVAQVVPEVIASVSEASLITNQIESAPISTADKFSLLDSIKKVVQNILNLFS